MAIKKPLVLTNGQPEQLQAGDSIVEVGVLNQTNGEAGSIVICTPVYTSAADTVKKAKADASGTMPFFGLVGQASITNGVSGVVQTDGILVATTGQWDAVAGTTGGLTFNTPYYISTATAGLLTVTPPTTGFSQIVVIGVSPTEGRIVSYPMYKL